MSTTTTAHPLISIARLDEDIGWVDVMQSIRHLEDLAVNGDQGAGRNRGALQQRPERDISIHSATMVTSMHLIAPAAALGPRCQMSSPGSFPARDILCTLNRHSVNGESKNYVKIWT